MPTKQQVDRLSAMQELERRGELPEQYQPVLDELRARGVVPPVQAPPTGGVLENFAAGIGQGLTRVGRGIEQALYLGADAPYMQRKRAELQGRIDEAQQLDQPLLDTKAGLAGSITGTIAGGLPVAFVPGAGTYPGATAIGAGLGALQPVATGESRAVNTGIGAAGGAAGRALVGGLSRLVSPQTAPAAAQMVEEGVELTPGQIGGGAMAALENKATSIPIVGDLIQSAHRRGIESFNKVAINKALEPIGKRVETVGREAIAEGAQYVKQAYDDALEGAVAVVDDQFQREIAGVTQLARRLPPERFDQIKGMLQSILTRDKFSRGRIAGEAFKEADSELGRLARTYSGSAVADERHVGEAMRMTQKALREMMARSNPEKAADIRAVDKAYAMFLRPQTAAASTGAHGGVFTPAQLKAAVKSLEPSLRKSGFSRGEALMQDFAETAQEAMPTFPTSGTTERAVTTGLAMGAGALEPSTLAWMAGVGTPLAGAYTKTGQALLRPAMTARPAAARAAGRALNRQGIPRSGVLGASLPLGYYQSP